MTAFNYYAAHVSDTPYRNLLFQPAQVEFVMAKNRNITRIIHRIAYYAMECSMCVFLKELFNTTTSLFCLRYDYTSIS